MACSGCVSGTLHEGTPTGTVETLYGLATYVASPPSGTAPKGTVVIIPDAFGWKFNNNRILADNYAKKGSFRVLLPDFMGGWDLNPELLNIMDYVTEKHESLGVHTFWKAVYVVRGIPMFVSWLYGARHSATWPGVLGYFKKLRSEDESQPIGAAGFCWGGKHVFLLARDTEKSASGKSLINAGFTAHPSSLKLPADIDAVKLPVSVACPSEDHHIRGDKILEVEAGLKQCPAECEVKTYEGATHGFAVRANPKVPKENEQGIEAEDQAISWFTKFFS
ncbi:alpha/beta-hydrolase [Rhizodiscina lignyota]|uniref:Alpha/beta-hydrolase n=1 Tax=Rhizodiscina lignyota TaxID=1504668 RepID=A0A9P4M235_9PEZI|nr:alpha/beta-hydrolase [Rhizodiscina lignyota]